MKKVWIALAMLAMTAMTATAQVELLATWSFENGSMDLKADHTFDVLPEVNATAANIEQVSFTAFSSDGVHWAEPSDSGRLNIVDWGNAGEGYGIIAEFQLSHNYEIVDAMIRVGGLNGDADDARLQWQVRQLPMDWVDVGTPWTVAVNAEESQADDVAFGITLTSTEHPSDLFLGYSDDTTNLANTITLWGDLKLYGTIREVGGPIPEPATMSLLGVGALAMVLRRKWRKESL